LYAPTEPGPEGSALVDFDVDEADPMDFGYMMIVFREQVIYRDWEPPAFQYDQYLGYFFSVNIPTMDTMQMEFERQPDGEYKLASMNLRFPLGANEAENLDFEGDEITPIWGELSDLTNEGPFGFDFFRRGIVKTAIPGDADVVYSGEGAEGELRVASRAGAIMMLPEGTDIFSIEPESYIDTLNMQTVRANPYDPNMEPGDDPSGGYVASAIPGRAYFVIAKDGEHYGFIQLAEQQLTTDPTQITDPFLSFFEGVTIDYRFEESFVIPDSF
jgi:hypothetical protein